MRLTVMQSFYIPNIKTENTAIAAAKLAKIGLPTEVSPIYSGTAACTGIQYCNLAVTDFWAAH